ncbi:unnamed protein product [Ceutorhynchus assimilis]|uniref:Uncharacterized protein n=1 Tax=Ceutorhynchus assimilis TaxID=467358 RepID=A0A9P0DF50_9CUCU|nr:unnamed protein product [Ceutorhynchus assimilis]
MMIPSHKITMSIQAINTKYTLKDCVKKEELEIGKTYRILNVTRMETKFGPSILVELEGEKSIFLPRRYDLTEDEIKKINDGCSGLIYKGGKSVGKPSPAAIYEFTECSLGVVIINVGNYTSRYYQGNLRILKCVSSYQILLLYLDS